MKTRSIVCLVAGYVALFLGIGFNLRESGATKAAIESQLAAGFSGLTGPISPTATWSKTATAIHNGVIVGTTTNDNASSGQIGEYVIATRAIGSSLTLVAHTWTSVASISLTAGDWDVQGVIQYSVTGADGSTTQVLSSISTIDNNVSSTEGDGIIRSLPPLNGEPAGFVVPPARISVAATTTVYLIGRAAFSAGTYTVCGRISARRVR